MTKRWRLGLSIAAAGLLAACSPWATEEVLLRKPSPDGAREAVLMHCRDPANPAARQLIGAVFRLGTGPAPDCKSLAASAATAGWFAASMQALPEVTGESVEWVEGGRAVFTLRRRIIISGTIKAGEPDVLEVRLLDRPEVR